MNEKYILKIIMYDASGKGGLSLYSQNLSKSLAVNGCDVSLLTTNDYLNSESNLKIIPVLNPGTTSISPYNNSYHSLAHHGAQAAHSRSLPRG